MRLQDVANHFAKTVFYDGYTGYYCFNGKLMAFDDSTRDSLASDRRVLSVAPGTVIPSRRVIKTGLSAFLVGDYAPDFHNESELREKYVVHRASELAKMRTFADALAGTDTKTFWGSRLWIKTQKEVNESSGTYDGYTIYCSKDEDMRDPAWGNGTFFDGREQYVLIQIDGRWHLVRTSYTTSGGFLALVVDELPEPVLPAVTYTSRTHDPVPDTYTTTNTPCVAVMLRWQSNFEYLTRYTTQFLNGDVVLKIAKTAVGVAKAGDLVDIRGRSFKVVAVTDEDPLWNLHIRHV
jgi:hypothetical protein